MILCLQESSASDFTDEAMLKLDESLAAVFRSHLTGAAARKSARDLAEQAQAFRVRCFDLVFVLLHSQPSAEVITVSHFDYLAETKYIIFISGHYITSAARGE